MPEENVELVRAALGAAARRPKPDFATLNELFHPDHVFVPVDVETTEAKGGAGYKAWLETSDAVMPWTMELGEVFEIDDRTVLAETRMRFHGEASEIDFDQRMWAVLTIDNQKITRTEAYLNRVEALKATRSDN